MKTSSSYIKREYKDVAGTFDHVAKSPNIALLGMLPISNKVAMAVYKETGVMLTAVGIYSRNTNDPDAVKAKERVLELLENYKDILQMHGFYLDKEKKLIKFDVIISFDAQDRESLWKEICQKMRELYPGYEIQINLDSDTSD